MKFSIIIPVYNVEDYIEKCLESINNQTYQKFEAIIIDDGSPDNSSEKIKKFIKNKKNFKYYKKENGGLSDARNYGLKYVTGDYIIFLDSDDYISPNLLEELEKEINDNNPDIIKYNLNIIENDSTRIMEKKQFSKLHPNDAIEILLEDELFEPAWLYCYKKEFWFKHNFKYIKGRIHEDFGLTPLILMNAKNISSIDYAGYNYIIRDGSIMNSKNPEKDYKKFTDCLEYFKENKLLINKSSNINAKTKQLLLSYYANGILNRATILEKESLSKALTEIKKEKIYSYLKDDTISRKLKKGLVKIFPKIYIKRLK